MNAPTKAHNVQTHNLILYQKALHPELFQMKARRVVTNGAYELEAWVMHGSHSLRFQHKKFCACELVTDRDGGLPTTGAVASFPCLGEKDFEHAFEEDGVNYITTMQTETLSDNLYRSTYQEMLAFADENDAAVVQWKDPLGGKNMSLLDLQRYSKEVHAQSYHLFASGGLVLRTQTIFEHE